MWYFAGNFITEMMPGYLQSAVLLKIKIADWLFCRTLACPLESFFELASENVFLLAFRHPRFAELVFAPPLLLR